MPTASEITLAVLWATTEVFRYLNRREKKTMAGIKELKEVVVAANEISLFIISRLKDGVGIDDAMAAYQKLTTDAEFKKMIADAHDGLSTVGGEVKDLDLSEGLELIILQAGYVPKFVEALKK